MKGVCILLLFALLCCQPSNLLAQSKLKLKTDSLITALAKAKTDTGRCIVLVNLADIYLKYAYNAKSLNSGQRALDFATKARWLKGEAFADITLGNYYSEISDHDSVAVTYLVKAYVIAQKQGNKQLNDKLNKSIAKFMSEMDYLTYREVTEFKLVPALNDAMIELRAAKKLNDTKYITLAYDNIGQIYNNQNDVETALKYYEIALEMAKKVNDKERMIKILMQISVCYYNDKKYELQEKYLLQALKITKEINYDPFEINLDLGESYIYQKKYKDALTYYKTNLNVKQSPIYKIHLSRQIASFYMDAPDSLLIAEGVPVSKRNELAIAKYNEFLDFFKTFGAFGSTYSQKINEKLSVLYERVNDYPKALKAYKTAMAIKDSLAGLISQHDLTSKEAAFEFEKKKDSINYRQQLLGEKLKQQTLLARQGQQQLLFNRQQLVIADNQKEVQHLTFLKTQADLQQEKNRRVANEQQLIATQKDDDLQKTVIKDKQKLSYYLFGGIAALVALSFFIAQNYRNQRKANGMLTNANTIITTEKKRSDDLLLNILPADVAEELKEKGSANARLFDEVTVLFTDFVNFTTISELLSPQELVDELHYCFKAFDGIMATHHIEKIKTIGDAYLAVAGLPNADANHAANTVKAALEIRNFIHTHKIAKGDKAFDIRIGIHSGSVVAGIVGVKKFAYDIWGDTVNTAARMEQNSEPGKINVSEKTYELVKDGFEFTYRGEIVAKNKGKLKMYFVG